MAGGGIDTSLIEAVAPSLISSHKSKKLAQAQIKAQFKMARESLIEAKRQRFQASIGSVRHVRY